MSEIGHKLYANWQLKFSLKCSLVAQPSDVGFTMFDQYQFNLTTLVANDFLVQS